MVFTLVACGQETQVDVSKSPSYATTIGTQYEIVGRLLAYGIRQHSQAPIEYVTLMPPPGIMGSSIVPLGEVPLGAVVTVIAVHRTNRVIDDPHTFVVSVSQSATLTAYPTRIDRFRGNEGNAGPLALNEAVFKPRPQAQ